MCNIASAFVAAALTSEHEKSAELRHNPLGPGTAPIPPWRSLRYMHSFNVV